MKKIPYGREWGRGSKQRFSHLLLEMLNREIRIVCINEDMLSINKIWRFIMKEKDKKSNPNETKKKQQQDSSFNMDEYEEIPPYEPYDKNRIDTTNL